MRKIAFACASILTLLLIGFSQPAFADPSHSGQAHKTAFNVHFKSSGKSPNTTFGGCAGYFILDMNSARVVGFGAHAKCTEIVDFYLVAELQECDPVCFFFHTKDDAKNGGTTITPFVSNQFVCPTAGTRTWRVKLTGHIHGIAVDALSDEESLPCTS
jgi:hypothetical protein